MTEDDTEIVGLSEISDAARTTFYQRTYPTRARWLAEHWRWWYRVGYLDGVEPLVAVSRGTVVGHAGVIPAQLRVGSEVRPALWFVDFAVLPGQQGRGLGKRLTEAWMQLGDTHITHCNDNSMRVFRKYGWAERHDMIRYARPIHLHPLLGEHRLGAVRVASRLLDAAPKLWARVALRRATRLEPHPVDVAQLMAAFESPDETGMVRDPAWLRWRLIESPFRAQYHQFVLRDARAVVRLFSEAAVTRLHVLWMGGGDAADRRALSRSVAAWGVAAGADMLWATTNQVDVMPAMSDTLPFKKPFRFAFFSRDAACFDRMRQQRIALQAIDSDTDLMYV